MIKLLQAKEDIYWEDSLPDQKPFENWKRDIGLGKFIRSTAKSNAVMCVIDDISGYLDIKNNLFYYQKKHKGQQTYLCCKVECSLDKSWHFIRENKDSSLLEASYGVLASFGVPEDSSESGGEVPEEEANTWTDKHYDFTYTLTEEDIEAGEIKIDPYFVNRIWKINSWDDTGAAFHSLKNYARICNNKNPLERDLKSLYKQVKRLCELHKVDLG